MYIDRDKLIKYIKKQRNENKNNEKGHDTYTSAYRQALYDMECFVYWHTQGFSLEHFRNEIEKSIRTEIYNELIKDCEEKNNKGE